MRTNNKDFILWQMEDVLVNYHQSPSLVWTQTNECTCTPTQKKSLCHAVSSVAVGSLQSVGLMMIASSSPTELGLASAIYVARCDMGGMTHDAALTSASVAFTFPCRRRSWGKSKNVDMCDSENTSRISLQLSLCVPNCIFSFHYLKFPILSSFSFSHNLSASLIVSLPACSCALWSSHTISVFLSVTLPAKPQLPDNLMGTG